jgi:periplasmic protein TonB
VQQETDTSATPSPIIASPGRAPETNKPIEQSAQQRRMTRREAPAADRTSAPPISNVRVANAAASPSSSAKAAPSAALASWKGAVVAHLNRFKRLPPAAINGRVAAVAFAIDRAPGRSFQPDSSVHPANRFWIKKPRR